MMVTKPPVHLPGDVRAAALCSTTKGVELTECHVFEATKWVGMGGLVHFMAEMCTGMVTISVDVHGFNFNRDRIVYDGIGWLYNSMD